MYGWQQWGGGYPGNAPGIGPTNATAAYGMPPNNGTGIQGGWIQGQQQMMRPPQQPQQQQGFSQMGAYGPGLMPQNPMHGGWQQQMGQNTSGGFGMGQQHGYRPVMMNPGYAGGGTAPPLPSQPPLPPTSSVAAPVETAALTNPKPPPPPPEDTPGTDKQKDVALTAKEAAEKERLDQLKQQAQQWQRQMATIQQHTTSALAYTAPPALQQQQFMGGGGEPRFPVSVTQQQQQPPLPVPPFSAPIQPPSFIEESTTVAQQPNTPSQMNANAPSQIHIEESFRPIEGPVVQNNQQNDSFRSGNVRNRAADNNKPKAGSNKPTVEPLMSQRILGVPPDFRVSNMNSDFNTFQHGPGMNRRDMQMGRRNVNDNEFTPGMRREEHMGLNQSGRRMFEDESLEQEFHQFRQRQVQQRFQDCNRGGDSNDEMLDMFHRSLRQDSQNVMHSNRGGMGPQRAGPGRMLGQREFDEPNQMARVGPLLGQRPSDTPNEMARGAPLLGRRPFEGPNEMGRGAPLLGQRPFEGHNEMGRGASVLGQRPFEGPNEMGRGAPLLGQRPFEGHNEMGRGAPLLGQRPFEGHNEMGRGASVLGQRPFEGHNEMGRGASVLGQRPFEGHNEMGRGAPLLGQRPFDDQNRMGRGAPFLGQRHSENPNEMQRGNAALLGQRPFEDSKEITRPGPLLGQRPFEEGNTMHRSGPSLGQRPFDDPNAISRGGPMLGQRPFDDPNAISRGGPMLGQRSFEHPDAIRRIEHLSDQRLLDDPLSKSLGGPQNRGLPDERNLGPPRSLQPETTFMDEREVPAATSGPTSIPRVEPQNVTKADDDVAIQEVRRDTHDQNALSQPAGEIDTPDKVMEEFTKKLASWNQQFQMWKAQNKDHPDKEGYYHYEKQWQEWRDKLLERHEQMKRLQTQRNSLQAKDSNLTKGVRQQQTDIHSAEVNSKKKDVASAETTTVAKMTPAQIPQSSTVAPTPLELAAKLLVGMAGPLLQNATSILSANKYAAKNIGQNKKDTTANKAPETKRQNSNINEKSTSSLSDYSPLGDQPVDMVLESDDEIDFAADNFDSFEPSTQILEAMTKKRSPTDPVSNESQTTSIGSQFVSTSGLVHPGPWKPLPSSILSSDRDSKLDTSKAAGPQSVPNISAASVKSGNDGRVTSGVSSITNEDVWKKPKDSGRNVSDAPFDFSDMLKNNEKGTPQSTKAPGWTCLISNNDSDNRSREGGRGSNRRKGQEQGPFGRQSDNSWNRSRFEGDRSYDGGQQRFLSDGGPTRGSPTTSQHYFDNDNSIPFCERTDVWDNPYLHDEDDEYQFPDQQSESMNEIEQECHNVSKNIPPLLPNLEFQRESGQQQQIRDSGPTRPPVNQQLSRKQRKRMKSRWNDTRFSEPPRTPVLDTFDNSRGIPSDMRGYGSAEQHPDAQRRPLLQNFPERRISPDRNMRYDDYYQQESGTSDFDQRIGSRRMQLDESRWFDDARRNNELPPLAASGTINRLLTNKEQDIIRKAAEELKSLQDRMEKAMPPPDHFTLDIHQIILKPTRRAPVVDNSQDDEPVEVGRVDKMADVLEVDRDDNLLDVSMENIQRNRDDRSQFAQHGLSGSDDVELLNRFWDKRSSEFVRNEKQTDLDRGLSSRDDTMEDRGGGEGGRDVVPISIDYGHGVPKTSTVNNLTPGQDVFDYFETMFNVDMVQTIDYGHGKKESSSRRDYDRYPDRSSSRPRESVRNRFGRERDRSHERIRERERSRDRIRERERSYERSRPQERSVDRIYGREAERSYDKGRDHDRSYDKSRDIDRARDRDHKHYERNRDDRGHTIDRNRERDSRSGFTSGFSGETEKDHSSRRDDSRPIMDQSFRSRDTQHSQVRNTDSILIEDLLGIEGRKRRPHSIVIILRGPPGSGKTFVAKLIKDKEIENGGSAPRMLCLDDYFMVESEQTEVDLETGKNVMKYEYEPEMEESYRNSLFKSFKKTIEDGFFPFIIVDAINNRIRHFEEIFSFAKHKGFQVYVAEMDPDPVACHKRNIHNRSLDDINKIIDSWESTPRHYLRVDVRSLLQDAAITEVEMEDLVEDDSEPKEVEEQAETEDLDGSQEVAVSKWEKLEATEEKLAKLDGLGLMKRKKDNVPQSLEDYLQLPDDYEQRECQPGQKRVRWADVEERKEQEKKQALGFVVGQTDWQTMTDPSHAEKALNRTKYI